eukprot:TRINITY_DN5361_c0_g1_i1.p3 TRINITY_DN5361_c0_g1~~TRINITY_DN5361_c0_g1_i1.p3  ORF type:complete len:65 (-),score=17.75 TRINITY_DN5361_c0_g1_i1:308-502(-)
MCIKKRYQRRVHGGESESSAEMDRGGLGSIAGREGSLPVSAERPTVIFANKEGDKCWLIWDCIP